MIIGIKKKTASNTIVLNKNMQEKKKHDRCGPNVCVNKAVYRVTLVLCRSGGGGGKWAGTVF